VSGIFAELEAAFAEFLLVVTGHSCFPMRKSPDANTSRKAEAKVTIIHKEKS
jgi:hypothetical protein